MILLLGIAGALAWCTVWIYFVARHCSRLDLEESVIMALGNVLPAFAATSGILAFLVAPQVAGAPLRFTLWAHHAAFIGLGIFLLASQALQIEGAWKLKRGASARSVTDTYARLRVLTEVAPAPLAVTILISGIGLVCNSGMDAYPAHDAAAYSLRLGWLAILVVGFSGFFWDGIWWYRPAARRMHAYWARFSPGHVPTGEERARFADSARDAQLLIHTLSYPGVLYFGLVRWPTGNWLGGWVEPAERALGFLPGAWPQAALIVVVWGAIGALIGIARRLTGDRS